jgi:hypothetical protein
MIAMDNQPKPQSAQGTKLSPPDLNPRFEDRREFTRVDAHAEVEVFTDGNWKISGSSANLSLNGLLLEVSLPSLVGKSCSVILSLPAHPEPLRINAKGIIVQSQKGKMGIQFTSVDCEDFDYLRNLVLYNSENPERVETEFDHHLGLKKPI